MLVFTTAKVIVFCLTECCYQEKYYLYAKIAPTRATRYSMTQVTPNKIKGLTWQLLRFLPFILAVVLWCLLTFKEQFFLRKVEDLSVFLFDKLFILESFRTPGGFLGLAGAFLTQFLHLPWLGALIWVFLLLLVYQLTIKVFNIPEQFRLLALLPVALLVIGNMSLGYGVFIMREQDHFFAPLLGYIVSLIPLASTGKLKTAWGKILFLCIWTIAGFALFGTFAFTGTLAAACAALVQPGSTRKDRLTVFASAIVFIVIVPLIIYSAYTTYRLADSWTAGLPSISQDVWTRTMRAPFQLALLCQILLALVSGKLPVKALASWKLIIIQSVICLAAIVSVWSLWFNDENFHTELAMSEAVDRFDWNATVKIFQEASASHVKSDEKAYASRTRKIASAQSADQISEIVDRYESRFFEPTRSMVMYRDLALLKTNRALDEAFTMKDGSRLQKSLVQIPMAWQSGKQFYFQYGLVNMSYRWCIEDAVEHSWSYSTLKYMAMHAIIMQEAELAEKYINKLEKTIFYRKWARSQRPLMSDEAAMAAAEPYKSVLPYMCFENRMTNDMVKTEVFLINHFLDQEPPAATPEYDRAALLIAMRIQNINRFWERLIFYASSNKVSELPRSVQEAALLYSSLERKETHLPFDDKVTESYDVFNRYVQSHPIRSMQESKYQYGQKFGKTFYYFYYFMRNLQTY